MTDLWKLHPTHLRKVARARRRWARLTLEERGGVYLRRWPMPGTAPAEMGRLIHELGVDCVIDVGAHRGGFGRICRRLGYAGDLVSFEPSTEAFQILTNRIRRSGDERWIAHQMALGASSSMLRLGVFEQTQLNSLRTPDASRSAVISPEPLSYEDVRVVPLDEMWDQIVGVGSTTLLKVDAQGYDIEVLRGAEQSLTKCAALQVEVSGVPLYEGVPPMHEVVTYLYDRSFRLTGLFPIMRNPDDRLQVVDFDATFVRVSGTSGTSGSHTDPSGA